MSEGEPEDGEPRALGRPPAHVGTPPERVGASRPDAPAEATAPVGELALLARRRSGTGVRDALRRVWRSRWAPLVALTVLIAFSAAGKSIDLSQPCEACSGSQAKYALTEACGASHRRYTLIFDESYYVNAARVIDGIEPPAGCPYHGDPKGKDPNAEHPQLAKLVIAAGIDVFGNDPLGWRIGSILFSAIALLALYALVVAAGGSSWLAVGTVAVACLDNLLLVHGRIATLDVYAVAMAVVAAVLYMRRRPLLAGVALGVAACMKEVALFLVFVFVLLEALRVARSWIDARAERTQPAQTSAGGADAVLAEVGAEAADAAGTVAARIDGHASSRSQHAGVGSEIRYGPARRTALAWSLLREHLPRLAIFVASSAAATLGVLWLLDALVPAYDPGTHVVYGGNPIAHLEHMYKYALLLKSKPNETGIGSSPLAWLLNETPINYAKVAVNTSVNGKLVGSRSTIAFLGEMNPFIIFLAVPALFAALAAWWRERDELAALGACWCLGTYLPFLVGDATSGRVSYLYYMLLVMPGIYIVTARMFASRWVPKAATVGWALMLVYGFVHLYPIRTLL